MKISQLKKPDAVILWSVSITFIVYWVAAFFSSFWRMGSPSAELTIALSLLLLCTLTGKEEFIIICAILPCMLEEQILFPGVCIVCTLFCSLFLWGYLERRNRITALLPVTSFFILTIRYYFFNSFALGYGFTGVIVYFLCCFTPWILGRLLLQKNIERET